MKIKKYFIINIIILFIIILPIIYASWGVSYPNKLELTRGESGRFKFGIDANQHEENMECTYNIPSTNLIIISDQEKINVNAKSITQVAGTINVPQDIKDGTYTEKFCVSCNDIIPKEPGTSVKANYCDIPLIVNVVSERTIQNPYVPLKEEVKKIGIESSTILLIGVLIAALLVLIYYIRKLNRK